MKHYQITSEGKQLLADFQEFTSFIENNIENLNNINLKKPDILKEEFLLNLTLLEFCNDCDEVNQEDFKALIGKDLLPITDNIIQNLEEQGWIENSRPSYQLTREGKGRINELTRLLTDVSEEFGVDISAENVLNNGDHYSFNGKLLYIVEELRMDEVWSYEHLVKELPEEVENFMRELEQEGYVERLID